MPVPPLPVDPRSPIPLHYQLSSQLMTAIESGQLAPGDKLPTESDLASSLGISRPTVRHALNELVERGVLVRRRGAGTRVTEREVRRQVELTSLYEDLAASGHAPVTKVLAFEQRCTDVPKAAREALRVDADEAVVYCERLRLAGRKPIAILQNWLTNRYSTITASELEDRGLYQLMDERGGRPAIARQRISARAATSDQAKLLRIEVGGPLVTMVRVSYAADGAVIEYADNVYRAEAYAFESTVYSRWSH
jgi:DNA-binding GntR family transcriptional regulator